ncbi:MAG TPA: DUF1918 domain-containing protein [Gaiellaceae bacterium]|jgi:hypothetical protein|nr:DUF1918 domain-containing protein [Gaiellaceae bacterium]
MNEATRTYRPHAGDVVTVDGRRVGESGRLGEILEFGGDPGHERLRVRWEDGRESVLYPCGDVRIRPKHRARSTARRRP